MLLNIPWVYSRYFLSIGGCCSALEGISLHPLPSPWRGRVRDGVTPGPVPRWGAWRGGGATAIQPPRAHCSGVLTLAQPTAQSFPFQVPRLRFGLHFRAQPPCYFSAVCILEDLLQSLQLGGRARLAERLGGLEGELLQCPAILCWQHSPDGNSALHQLVWLQRFFILARGWGWLKEEETNTNVFPNSQSSSRQQWHWGSPRQSTDTSHTFLRTGL